MHIIQVTTESTMIYIYTSSIATGFSRDSYWEQRTEALLLDYCIVEYSNDGGQADWKQRVNVS